MVDLRAQISLRYSLTKVPSPVLSVYYCKGYPLTPKMADRPYNQYGTTHYSEEKWDELCRWLTRNPTLGSNSRAIRRHLGITWATVRKPLIQATKPAALKQEVPQLQQGLPGTASLPPTFALRVVLRVVAVV